MKQSNAASNAMPVAHVAINKSRLKVYNNVGSLPTYYLQKGQEFQIELFNPTQDVIMAKISLNSKPISQGGLVLRPGERVFLDRYLDVAKKFMFDTYEVSGSNEEVKKAIENNGDFKVEFYREQQRLNPYLGNPIWITNTTPYVQPLSTPSTNPYIQLYNNSGAGGYVTTTISGGNITLTGATLTNSAPVFGSSSISNSALFNQSTSTACIDQLSTNCSYTTGSAGVSFEGDVSINGISLSDMAKEYDRQKKSKSVLRSKSIETGRVETGSASTQKIDTVSKSFEFSPFWMIEYKLMPMSQKVNTTKDVSTRRYCTNCGRKQGATDKFCGGCGIKQ